MSVPKFNEIDPAICYNCLNVTKCRNDGFGFLCEECWNNLYGEDEDESMILHNKRVFEDDFEEDMWVWNETQKEYQRLRYCKVIEDYHWCDGWGNVIEDDELWLYNFYGRVVK